MLLNCDIGEDSWESPSDCKEIQPVHPKGDQSWVFIGRTDVEAESLILWPSDAKSWFIWKDPDAGKDWRREEKGMTEDEMAGWHYWLNGRESGWTPWVGDGQGGLACCSPWGRKESNTTDWTELNWTGISQTPWIPHFSNCCLHFSSNLFLILVHFINNCIFSVTWAILSYNPTKTICDFRGGTVIIPLCNLSALPEETKDL